MSDSGDNATERVSSVPDDTGWRLIDQRTGRLYRIPPQGLVIGRDDACDVVLTSKGVSRRHAVIRFAGTGVTITDESSNGTYVNDARVRQSQTLARGDTIRFGPEIFKLESGSIATTSRGDATEYMASVNDAQTNVPPRRPSVTGGTALATLEVTKGPLAGTRYTVTRPVCSIGKTEENDIVVAHGTVSATHASLMLKAGTWYIVDLRSLNGTYIDGYRVAAERELPAGATLSVGEVRMVFKPAMRMDGVGRETPKPSGLMGKLGKLLGR